jgi:hypothetical protein
MRAVSQLLWSEEDCEVWFSLEENHENGYGCRDFLQRSTGREQGCAIFFAESRRPFSSSNNIRRKSNRGNPAEEIQVRSTPFAKLL